MSLERLVFPVFLAAATLLSLAGESRAGFAVQATFNGSVGGTFINGGGVFNWTAVSYGTEDNPSLGDIGNYTPGTVPVDYRPIRFPGMTTNSFQTFCIEVNENISTGSTYIYELTHDIHLTPQDNGGQQPNGMGLVAAGNLRRLFGTYFSTLDTDTEYQAFQLAIWEIVADSNTGLNLGSGAFSYGSNNAARTQANTYLTGLTTGTASIEAYNLVVLTRDGFQDQVGIFNTPAPPTALLGLTALLPLAAYGWRRFPRK